MRFTLQGRHRVSASSPARNFGLSVVVLGLLTSGVVPLHAEAASVRLPALPVTKSVPGHDLSRPAPQVRTVPSAKPPVVTWPTAASARVDLGVGARSSGTVGPMQIARLGGGTGPALAATVTDQKTARRAGVTGVLFALQPDPVPAGTAKAGRSTHVEISYEGFGAAIGADWSARLRLVSMPPCALTTPQVADCQRQTPVPSSNDADRHVVSADLDLAPSASESTARGVLVDPGAKVFAMVAGPSGSTGSYAATPLSPSGSWSAGGSTGGFSWALPIEVPPSLGGPSPQIQVGYSSQGVDGRQSSTNNQSSWIGDGWDFALGYIERQYKPCADDVTGSNTSTKTGDQCWYSWNATLSLGGKSSELVRDDATGSWRLATHDGTRVERLTGATNGDNDGEYWRVTTPDGTQYYFGQNRLSGWVPGNPETGATFTVPVYGNHPGEPCYASTFAASSCTQAYKWNLDRVVDPRGNSMVVYYAQESNNYGKNLQSTGASYTRGGYPVRVEYGLRSGSEYTAKATARVLFTVSERCLPDAGFGCTDAEFTTANATRWPDTPVDQNCATGQPCTTQHSPTFWTRKRLTAITTQSLTAASTYTDVNQWNLTHTFPATGDGMSPALWLSSIQRTGKLDGTETMPAVTFNGIQLANRVDTASDGIPAIYRWRVNTVYAETGAVIGVDYSTPECSPTNKPASDATNTMRCYPVYWAPEGAVDPIKEYFHKYVVLRTFEQDRTTDQPAKTTSYQYLGGAAWTYDRGELTKDSQRTWNQYRGYGTVRTLVGASPDVQSVTQTLFFRGLDGDRTATGGVRSANVVDADNVSVVDSLEFAGQPREVTYLNGTSVVSRTKTKPWRSAILASRVRPGTNPLESRAVQVAEVVSKTNLGNGTWRESRSTSSFDDDGQVLTAEELGDVALSGDETCTTITRARNTTAWIINLPSRVIKVARPCSVTASLPADFMADVRTMYDGASSETTPPTQGLPTRVDEVVSWPDGGSATVATTRTATYDGYGRQLTSTDALGRTSETTYTQTPAGGPVTAVTSKNALGHASTSYVDPRTGTEVAAVDPNARRTEVQLDPLGRVAKVWFPGRVKGTNSANTEYTYAVSATTPTVITTRAINDDGSYRLSYDIYDGMMRLRQTQMQGSAGGRLVSDTYYNTRGEVWKSNATYYNGAAPGGTLFQVGDNVVPTQTRRTYDAMGRITAEILSGFGVEKWRTTTSYDGIVVNVDPPAGQPATATVTDARGRITQRRRYPSGSISGAYDSTTYTYDAKGMLSTVTDPGGAVWSYAYDIRGRQTKAVDPDKGTSTMTYDAAGQLVMTTNATGATIARTYDSLGRVLTTRDGSVTGAVRTETVYDTVAKGLVTSSSRVVGSNRYTMSVGGYDIAYRPTSTSYVIPASEGALSGTYTTSQTYTLNGSVATQTYPAAGGLAAETVRRTYDQLGNEIGAYVGLKAYQGNTIYDAYGSVLRTHLGSGAKQIYVSYLYEDTTRRLQSIAVDRDVAPTRLEERIYGYDPSGDVTSNTSTALSGTDRQCFRYDGLGRTTEAWTASSSCSSGPVTGVGATVGGVQPYWHSYTYDARDNRATETLHDPAGSASATIGRTYAYPTSAATMPHALQSVAQTGPGAGTDSYTYDAAGNLKTRVEDGVTTGFTWDPEGHLATSTTSGQSTSFLYDAAGNRLIKREPGATTLYLGTTEVRLPTGAANPSATRMISLGGAVLFRTSDGKNTYVVSDQQGTGVWAIDGATLSAVQRKMTAFGADRDATAVTFPADKGFVGGTKDASTRLTHLGAREYDPHTGRFVSVDPLIDISNPAQMNGYSYSAHNPATFSDPSGAMYMVSDSYGGPTTSASTAESQLRAAERDSWNVTVAAAKAEVAAAQSGNSGARPTYKGPSEDEVRQAQELKNKSVLDIIIEEGGQILLDVLGINDIKNCFTQGDIGACAMMIAGAVPWGKIFKAKDIVEGGIKAFKAFMRWQDEAREAEALIKRADDAMAAFKRESEAFDNALACPMGNSFTPDTEVVMADGSTKRIDEISVGDEVLSTDPSSSVSGGRPVEGVIVGSGPKDLVRISVAPAGGSDQVGGGGSVVATSGHPFWLPDRGEWLDAGKLTVGDLLRTSSGTYVQVTALQRFTAEQRVHNLTVSGLHTYFVVVGGTTVLAHNCPPGADFTPHRGYEDGYQGPIQKREPASVSREKWEAEHGEPWPQETNGRNLDVGHEQPLADLGSNDVRNIEPVSHADHVQQHSERGDFSRWSKRGK